jgi:hypothetical protein
VNEVVSILPRGQSSPLGARGEVKNRPQVIPVREQSFVLRTGP